MYRGCCMSDVIDDHRKGMMMSGNLSDFQIKNLKAWPLVLFESIEQSKVGYNFSSNNKSQAFKIGHGQVKYDINTKDKIDEDRKQQITQILSYFVKFMFWKETEVEIVVNGELWTK